MFGQLGNATYVLLWLRVVPLLYFYVVFASVGQKTSLQLETVLPRASARMKLNTPNSSADQWYCHLTSSKVCNVLLHFYTIKQKKNKNYNCTSA